MYKSQQKTIYKISYNYIIKNLKLLIKIRSFFQKDFIKNITLISAGAFFGQISLFLVTPIIARLYLPEHFGSLSVFTSVVVVLAIFSTGRYEYAILLAKSKTESFHLTFLGGILSIFFGIFILLAFSLLYILKIQISFFNTSDFYIFFIPVVLLFSGINSCILYLLIRYEKYKDQSLFNFLQPVVIILLNLGLGFLGYLKYGLIISFSLSSIISFLILSFLLRKEFKSFLKESTINYKYLKVLFLKYINFPKYQLPAQALFSFAQQSTPVFFASFFSMTLVGFYSLANRLLSTPVNIIGSSVSSVFRNEVIKSLVYNSDFSSLFLKTFKQLLFIALPIFTILYLFLPYIFDLVLGPHWSQAAKMGRLLCLLLFFDFISSPLSSSIFILKEKQKLNLLLQIYAVTLNVAAILLGYIIFKDIYYCLVLMVFAGFFNNLLALIMSFRLSKGNNLKY